jgi:hypothetical protein
VRHEVARLVAGENDDREVLIVLDAPDERGKLVKGVRVQQIHRAVIEDHSPVGSGDLTDPKLFCRIHEPTVVQLRFSVQHGPG